jgi:hypothetical protein
VTADVTDNAVVGTFKLSPPQSTRTDIFGDDQAQSGERVAYVPGVGTALLFAGTFAGTVDLVGGGTSLLTSTGGKDIFVGRFEGGSPLATKSASFGSAAAGVDQEVHGLAADATGNVYLAGTLRGTVKLGASLIPGGGGDDAFVIKLDPSLSTTLDPTKKSSWLARFGDGDNQSARAVAVSADGSRVYVAGQFKGAMDFGNKHTLSATTTKLFIAKLYP